MLLGAVYSLSLLDLLLENHPDPELEVWVINNRKDIDQIGVRKREGVI